MKKCNGPCELDRPDTDFYVKRHKNGTAGLRAYCKECSTKERDEWRKTSGSGLRQLEYNRENAHIIRGNKLAKYWPGTDWKQATAKYAELLASQGGVCAVCACKERRTHKETGRVWDLAVDHCHVTGKVRGLLCNACNRGLGLLKDSIDGLERAVVYLKKAA